MEIMAKPGKSVYGNLLPKLLFPSFGSLMSGSSVSFSGVVKWSLTFLVVAY